MPKRMKAPSNAAIVAATALPAMLVDADASLGRVTVWSDMESLASLRFCRGRSVGRPGAGRQPFPAARPELAPSDRVMRVTPGQTP